MCCVRLNLIVLLMLMTADRLVAQWVDRSPSGIHGGSYTCVYMEQDAQNGWSVGPGGTAMRTTDGGETWSSVYLGISNYLTGVFFVDQSTGWIIGGKSSWNSPSNAIIMGTTNGGSSWTIQYTSHEDLNGLYFTDRHNGWIVGSTNPQVENEGLILHTTDGGSHWAKDSIFGDLYSVKFLNQAYGFLGGSGMSANAGVIHRTTDGGKSITDYALTGDMYSATGVPDIAWADSNRGFCVTGELVFNTTNAGANWKQVFSYQESGRYLNHVSYLGGSSWLVSSSSVIFKTTDDGNSWDTSLVYQNLLPYSQIWNVNDIVDMKFVNSNSGLVLIRPGYVYLTADGGTSWTLIEPTLQNLNSIDLLSTTSLIVGGDGGRVFKSTDAGDTWTILKVPTTTDVLQTDFISEKDGWATTLDDFYRTSDGGSKWILTSSACLPNPLTVFDTSLMVGVREQVLNGNHGFSVQEGNVVRSTDGGRNWTQVYAIDYFVPPGSIYFWNSVRGLASLPVEDFIGSTASVLQTSDSGKTWSILSQISFTDNISSFSFVSDSIGFALADSGRTGTRAMIVKTSDGGRSWKVVSEIDHGLSSLCFVDAWHGWACGAGGMIYRSSNGGTSWLGLQVNPAYDLNVIKFADTLSGYAIGGRGLVLRTDDGGLTFVSIRSHDSPISFALSQNYPNPFNPSTMISYQLPANSHVSLKIYDVLGREVETLVNERQTVGIHSVTFEAVNLPSGVYFYRLQASLFTQTKKLVVLK